MSVIDLPGSPSSITMKLQDGAGRFPSPLTPSAQIIDRGTLKWLATYAYSNISHDKRGELLGAMAAFNGTVNQVRILVQDNPKRGGYGGTPLVNGASQTGYSINIDGVTNKTNWIRAGDYFSIDVNGEHELKMATADANSSGGAVTISFVPKLRASPLNNAVVYVEDGTLPKPRGIFRLQDNIVSWSSRPFQSNSEISSITLSFIEDLFATQ